MSKYRIVPFVNSEQNRWKVQKKESQLFVEFWADVLDYWVKTPATTRVFYNAKEAEDYIKNELRREKEQADHLASPIKEYGE